MPKERMNRIPITLLGLAQMFLLVSCTNPDLQEASRKSYTDESVYDLRPWRNLRGSEATPHPCFSRLSGTRTIASA